MSPAIAYPSTVRKWNNDKPLNATFNDFHTEQGVRISQPIYIDLPTSTRKELLNGVRSISNEPAEVEQTVNTVSDIRTISSSTRQPEVESFLGMSLDILRGVLFQRGGLSADLVFRLQQVTGIEVVNEKDVKAAFKQRQTQLLTCLKGKPNAS